ncbi:DUF456 domain-containing protein [Azohydromonas aeria]|uniref:DUF456 domain-containing protein n=1 Tax=Azohydromonas aeria TaxID=2590212 RepID=UPI0012FBFAB5|nr:DUF456 domain-containing protein [Azohydromonas aeria]
MDTSSLLWVAAVVAVLLGLAGVVLPLLPGTPLLFGGLWLAAWLDGYSRVSMLTVGVLAVMALLAWVADYAAAALGVKRAGASGRAMAGAAIGALLGAFAGLPGLILGPVLGAVIGEFSARRHVAQATRAGVAAGLGFVIAIAAKLGLALGMLGVFAFAYFV